MRQVLPVVGAAIGAYFGGAQGAQWGWAIGSVVGNAVDPLVIKGPSIGDLTQQTSQEGVPRAIFFALSQPVSGNIVACSQPKIVTKRQRQGKGGPVTETQSVYRTYAIAAGEGPITTFIRVWSNGKLVYDARPGGDTSNNAKFTENAVFYLGTFDQMPDAHLEAIFGAGNVPAMRGTCYIAWHDIDLTNQGGAVPQYVFQVMRCEGTMYTSRPYALEIDNVAQAAVNLTRVRLEDEPYITDETTVAAQLMDIQIFGGSQSYTYAPVEEAAASADLVSIEIFGGSQSYNYAPPEEVAMSADLVSIEIFGDAVSYNIADRDNNNVSLAASLISITLE